ncbi:MAG: hypothetical protein H7301_08130 [Cryobacterium sp.]|nr:hypothetical protein [Oligoflexia bacterium]
MVLLIASLAILTLIGCSKTDHLPELARSASQAELNACLSAICGDAPEEEIEDQSSLSIGQSPKADQLVEFERLLDRWMSMRFKIQSETLASLTSEEAFKPSWLDEGYAVSLLFNSNEAYTEEGWVSLLLGPEIALKILEMKSSPEYAATFTPIVQEANVLSSEAFWRAPRNFGEVAKRLKKGYGRYARDSVLRVLISPSGIRYLRDLDLSLAPLPKDFRRIQKIFFLVEWVKELRTHPILLKQMVANFRGEKKDAEWNRTYRAVFTRLTSAHFIKNARAEQKESKKAWRAAYRRSLHLGVRGSEVPKFQAQVWETAEAVLAGMQSHYSHGIFQSDDFEKLKSSFTESTYQLPPTPAEVHQRFIEWMEDDIAYRTQPPEEGADPMSTLMNSIDDPMLEKLGRRWNDPQQADYFADFFDRNEKKIVHSVESITAHEFEAVTAHEMGHAWSDAISRSDVSHFVKEDFSATTGCLAGQHRALGASDAEAQRYGEEDFADLISASFRPNERNQFCHPIRQFPSDVLSFDNPDRGDLHSSPLFRLVHTERLHTGGLPEACRSLPELSHRQVFRDCHVRSP